MKGNPFVLDARPVRSERLTPREYLELQKSDPTLIARAIFLPPTTGRRGFGMFDVRYTRARYRTLARG